MFQDGPYYMGLLKTGVPEQSGKWEVATAPYSKQPGSYLGGTGLGIPVQAEHKEAAWLLVQYLLRPENAGRRLHLRRRRAGHDRPPSRAPS